MKKKETMGRDRDIEIATCKVYTRCIQILHATYESVQANVTRANYPELDVILEGLMNQILFLEGRLRILSNQLR